MDFKKRMRLAKYLKYAIVFCLILLFLWWGRNAVLRYWSQPLSTDISYNYGETKPGNQFPLITLCNRKDFYQNPIIKSCSDGSWKFISTIVSCMKSSKTFKEADLMQSLHPEIGNIVEMVQFWTGSKYINVQHLDKKYGQGYFLMFLDPATHLICQKLTN